LPLVEREPLRIDTPILGWH